MHSVSQKTRSRWIPADLLPYLRLRVPLAITTLNWFAMATGTTTKNYVEADLRNVW